jgi:acetylornithine deacetylase
MDCRISTFPGFKPQEMQRDIEDAVRKAASGHPFLSNNPPEVAWNGFFTEGYDLEPGSDVETVLTRCHERITGKKPVDYIATAYIDSRVFVLYGGMPCMVYGPVCEDAHGFDERVNIPSIRDATKAIALFIADWCGVEPTAG